MKKILFLMLICAMSSFSLMAQDEKVVVVDKGVKIAVEKITAILDEAELSLYPQQLTVLKEALQAERTAMRAIVDGNKGGDYNAIKPQINAIKLKTDDQLRKILKVNQFAAIQKIRGVKPLAKTEAPKRKVTPHLGVMGSQKAPAEVGAVEETPTKTVPAKEGEASKPMVKEAPVKAIPKGGEKELNPATSKSPSTKMQETPNESKAKPDKVKAPKKKLKSLDMMKYKLADGGQALSAEQEAKLERVLRAERKAIQAARKHAGEDKEAFKAKAKEIRKSNASQIKNILTPKQFKLIKATRKAKAE